MAVTAATACAAAFLALDVGIAAAGTVLPPVVAPAGGYPDGRAPELISPVDKNFGFASSIFPLPVGATGDAIAFGVSAGLPDNAGYQEESTRIARRTADGWRLEDATIPSRGHGETSNSSGGAAPQFVHVFAFDHDFTRMLLTDSAPLTDGEEGEGDLDAFRYDTHTRSVEWLTDTGVTNPTGTFDIVGASEDLASVVLASQPDSKLTPGGSSNSATIYRRRNDATDIVSRLPDGSVAGDEPGSNWVTSYSSSVRGFGAPGAPTAQANNGLRGVSSDGSRVLFGYRHFDNDSGALVDGLYLRDGDDRTVAVSASRRVGDAGSVQRAEPVGMSADGGTVYFVSDSPLTSDADGGGLYRYRVAGNRLDRLTRAHDQGGSSISTAIASADGSTVYFVSSAALAPGGEAGRSNAYVWSDEGLQHLATWDGPGSVSRVSRQGRFAVFASAASIDGANNGDHEAIYLARREDGRVRCASCRPDGSVNDGDANLDEMGPTSILTVTAPRNITDDGHVFFGTTDRLVGGDVTPEQDVYDFDGTRPELLTSGRGGASFMGDNTDDGRTVFVRTSDRLVRSDTDTGDIDLYALRAGGGFADPAEPAAPCVGDACQPAPASPPRVPDPASTATAPAPSSGAKDPRQQTLPLRILRVRTDDRRVTVSVKAPAAGRLEVAGRGTRTAAVRATKAGGVYTLRARLTAASRRTLRRTGKVRVTLRVRFVPANGTSASTSKTVTIRRAGRERARITTAGASSSAGATER